jgi:hypothetical protein
MSWGIASRHENRGRLAGEPASGCIAVLCLVRRRARTLRTRWIGLERRSLQGSFARCHCRIAVIVMHFSEAPRACRPMEVGYILFTRRRTD